MENIDITLDSVNVSNVNDVLTGPQGPAGFSPIATVSKTGNTATITITDENGTTTAQVTDGTDGADGQNNTLTIGTVTSGDTPSATITGDSPNQVLNLVLVQGDAGEDGVTPTIEIGNVTTVSPDTPASVTNSGTDTAVVLNFEIPQGQQGDITSCLSTPTVVSELPATGDPSVFYFVPKTYTSTDVTGTTITMSITDNAGRFSKFNILGNTVQSTVPSDPESLTGIISLDINGDTQTIDLGQEYLAKVTTHQDYIYSDGENWYIHREVGYISNYTSEVITTDYISTSGTLTAGDVVYYALPTAEEVQITNATLLVDLNLIKTMTMETGTNTITTTANVPADLDVSYYSFDINNQYDKYVYLIESSNYERIG